MKGLTQADYEKVVPLIAQAHDKGHLGCAYAVVEGHQAGRIFVDDTAAPTSALVCNFSGFYSAVGEAETSAFRAFVPELLSEHLGDEATLILALSDAWQEPLDDLFARKFSRTAFHYPPAASSC